MQLGLFGGSFNPPHRAHWALAQAALAQLQLDRLIVMPAGQPWQKAGQGDLAPAAHRLAMTQLAFAGMDRVEVSALEIERDEPSATATTLARLRVGYPQAHWTLVIGQDQYARLSTWRQVDALLASCRLAVAARAGQSVQADPALPPHAVTAIEFAEDPVSASEIRRRLSRGEDITPLVGPHVAGYIAQHHLYGA
ncbi:nicotinate (nicotinamide) nucleotide adenylyltransferase [Inhella gelatinilytica]|uniref:Probable nicotinate-nucleotide adenylyltransferase n=1 Tax=Inhella gelatinilytica TaxID=2795030 RepID=A0A931NFZ1_9BURK|nr:nicotinate (nicotinamide) nucleotide adenylyltransferase [Inhella gelatinilytica]MBH9554046.1 nicotinate (nicotinamide) nucleotide adenylyltransferase [Inhella gelatinilytica]